MIKRDRIFYSACGIFLVGIILAILDYEVGLLFLVGAYLLRPTLHAFDLADKYADERQVVIHSRSGNVAFIAVMLAAVGFSLLRVSRGEYAEELYSIIFIGIAARAMVGLLMTGDLRKAGPIIIIAIGLLISLFALFSSGFTTPGFLVTGLGLVFAATGLLGRKYPRSVAMVMAVIAVVLIFYFDLYQIKQVNMAMLIVVLAMLTAAVCFYLTGQEESKAGGGLSRTTRGTLLGAAALVVLILFVSIGNRPETAQDITVVKAGTENVPGEIQIITGKAPFDYHSNGSLASCTLAHEDTLSGQPLAEGTVVNFTEDGIFDWCFLQTDTEIQGHLCRGESHGFMTGFHPNGQLKTAWLARDEVINGIPCAKFKFLGNQNPARFHPNGRLSFCTLAEDITFEGQAFKQGDDVRFDEQGQLIQDKTEEG